MIYIFKKIRAEDIFAYEEYESASANEQLPKPGLNQGPLDLQSNALPTELFRLALDDNY